MKKHFFVLGLVGLLSLLMACSDLADSTAYSKQGGGTNKVKVSLSCTSSARSTIMPTNLEFSDITKISLTAKKLSGNDYVNYDLDESDTDSTAKIWLPSGEGVTSLTAYENMTSDSLELDFGSYVFTLDLYTDYTETDGEGNSTTKSRITQTGTLGNEDEETPYTINADTTTLSFTTEYVDYGRLSLNFQWNLVDVNLEKHSPIGSIKVALYDITSDSKIGELVSDTEATISYSTSEIADSTSANGKKTVCVANYEPNIEIPNGSYYIKFYLYDLYETNLLNTITDIVKIHGYKTEYKVEIDPDKVNWILIPSSGTISYDSNLLDISATGNLYLNMSTIEFDAYFASDYQDLSTNKDIVWDATLYYGNKDINDYGDYYEVVQSDGTNKAKLKIVNKLDKDTALTSYRLYLTATYNGLTSSATVSVPNLNREGYIYDLDSYEDDEAWQTAIEADMASVSSVLEIVVSGTADGSKMSILKNVLNTVEGYRIIINFDEVTGLEATTSGMLAIDNLIHVDLPSDLSTIVANTFAESGESSSVQTVSIPALVSEIEDGAFSGCTELSQIIVDEKNGSYQDANYDSILVKIVQDTQGNVVSKTVIASAPQAYALETYALETLDFSSSDEDINLAGITEIGPSALANCDKLTSITSFGNVKKIDDNAFEGCSKLESVNLSGVEIIYSNAFYGCTSLTTIEIPESLYGIGRMAFATSDGTRSPELTVTINYTTGKWYYISDTETVEIDGTSKSAGSAWASWIESKPSATAMPSGVSGLSTPFDYFSSYISDGGNGGTWCYKASN